MIMVMLDFFYLKMDVAFRLSVLPHNGVCSGFITQLIFADFLFSTINDEMTLEDTSFCRCIVTAYLSSKCTKLCQLKANALN